MADAGATRFPWADLSAWIVIGVGTAAVVGANTSEQSGSWFSGSAGLVALAVANAMGISGHFSWMVNSCTLRVGGVGIAPGHCSRSCR